QPGRSPAPYEGQSYEQLFPRYRKLQLILVFVGLHRQLFADDVRGRDPAALDRLTYAELFRRYRSALRQARAVEEQQYLASWRAGLTPPGGDAARYYPRLAVVAVTGGANRSALWTDVALDELENRLRGAATPAGESHFPRHVRLIAGASGGMVGAAHYVATLDDRGRHV